jgi:hypothetical protein
MATNPQTRRALIDQIPTEEDRQAPAAQPQSGIHSSELGRQVYNTAMALPGVGGIGKVAQTGGLVSRALNTTAGVANKVATSTAALAALPAGAEAPEPAPAAQPASAAGAGRGTVNPPTAGASNPLVEASRQVAPGIYRAGNSYAGTGDAAVSLDREPKGPPSAQNMAAADQLAANQQMESISRVATSGNVPQSPPQGLIGRVTATHSGNDWTAREMLRRQKTNADSLIHQSHWAPKGSARAAQASYQNAAAEDMAAMTRGQTSADVEVMRQNAGLMGEQMRQTGADRRDARRSLIDAARLGQDGQRLSMERETQQIQNRPRSLIASLQEQIAAEQDSTRRDSLVQRMRDIEGKGADVDPYLVVPGGQQTNSEGQVYTAPSSVFNRRSGAFLQQPAAQRSAVPQAAIADLKRDPSLAAQFDAKYGAGVSRTYLGGS